MNRFLLDTNHATHFIRFSGRVFDQSMRRGGEYVLCRPVVGELWTPVFAGSRRGANEESVLKAIELLEVLDFDAEAAREYGRIKHELARIGSRPQQVDVQVMAIAVVHDLTVLTADAHFANVPGIAVENWLA